MRRGCALAAVLGVLAGAAPGADLAPPTPDPDARQLAERVEHSLRSDACYLEATLRIAARRTDRLELAFRAWDDRQGHRTFVRVIAPPERAGTGFLRLGPNVWSFAPRGEGPRRIPPEGLRERWMGSHFSHDDLLHGSSQVDDYRHRLLGEEQSPEWAPGASLQVLESLPRPGVPSAWGRIVTHVDARRGTPLRLDYFDEGGALRRTLHLEEFREVQGRQFPHRWRMVRTDKQARESVLEVREVRFDQRLDDAVFTTRHLVEVE